MPRPWLAAAFVLGSAALATPAQDTKPAPVPGPFRVYVVADNRFEAKSKSADKADKDKPAERDPRDRTNKLHDFVIEQGQNPVVVVLTRTGPTEDGPGAKVAKELAKLYADKSLGGTSLGAFVAFLMLENEYAADDQRTPDGGFVREDKAKQVRALSDAVAAPRVPFGLAARTSPQATTWGLTDTDDTVVVVTNKTRVVKRWAFPAGGLDDAALKAILDVARAEAKK